jgi:hypothetical protein
MELIINKIGDQGAKPDVSHAPAVMEQEFIPLGLQWYQAACKRIHREEWKEFKEDRPRML